MDRATLEVVLVFVTITAWVGLAISTLVLTTMAYLKWRIAAMARNPMVRLELAARGLQVRRVRFSSAGWYLLVLVLSSCWLVTFYGGEWF